MTGSARWRVPKLDAHRLVRERHAAYGCVPIFFNQGKPHLLPSRLPDRKFCYFQYASTMTSM